MTAPRFPSQDDSCSGAASLGQVRTLFISDLHLGTPDCQAALLSKLLRRVRPERLYLVGDIVDLLAMRKRAVLDKDQQALVARVLRLARSGCEVIYIPGNHDASFRRLCGVKLHNVSIERRAIHVTASGRRLLVSHGDEFDTHVRIAPWLLTLGDGMHGFILSLNRWCNRGRSLLGLPYWSLASALKRRSGTAQRYVAQFEEAAMRQARLEGLDGYIGGHIHQAGFRVEDGVLYCNDGDWVEHCTALAEDADGALHLIDWQGQIIESAPRFVMSRQAVIDPAIQQPVMACKPPEMTGA
ncbi:MULTISPECIES: UDP-2,3-diacylglucosamine diphosphatase [Cobetia]|uniref:UDP-2,3-diacylglucosamine diphosphatase n=1 Tax=Cobetia crustatorum TaxID=553385 RepID=A0A558HRT5_9GAMM|nr:MULTISPECIES: UDP-2,3-diacylglucosamine diphosphatase [Cobetia]TVU71846.1 UDP-2,3-diacylglucosamine diphosphatase [Cobetia crustatorum]